MVSKQASRQVRVQSAECRVYCRVQSAECRVQSAECRVYCRVSLRQRTLSANDGRPCQLTALPGYSQESQARGAAWRGLVRRWPGRLEGTAPCNGRHGTRIPGPACWAARCLLSGLLGSWAARAAPGRVAAPLGLQRSQATIGLHRSRARAERALRSSRADATPLLSLHSYRRATSRRRPEGA